MAGIGVSGGIRHSLLACLHDPGRGWAVRIAHPQIDDVGALVRQLGELGSRRVSHRVWGRGRSGAVTSGSAPGAQDSGRSPPIGVPDGSAADGFLRQLPRRVTR